MTEPRGNVKEGKEASAKRNVPVLPKLIVKLEDDDSSTVCDVNTGRCH